jgi:Arc/MetJ-type ribon-helix-helix transcriptional regulator
MVKSTVRFPESLINEIDTLVQDGKFESKSEFHRFATEYLLSDISPRYQPTTLDYEQVKADVLPETRTIEQTDGSESGLPFVAAVSIIRRYALRGEFRNAEDFIDSKYSPTEKDALLLEELLALYRLRTAAHGQSETD